MYYLFFILYDGYQAVSCHQRWLGCQRAVWHAKTTGIRSVPASFDSGHFSCLIPPTDRYWRGSFSWLSLNFTIFKKITSCLLFLTHLLFYCFRSPSFLLIFSHISGPPKPNYLFFMGNLLGVKSTRISHPYLIFFTAGAAVQQPFWTECSRAFVAAAVVVPRRWVND